MSYAPFDLKPGCHLWYMPNAVPDELNNAIIDWCKSMMREGKYKSGYSLHMTWQAGVAHVGAPFAYQKEDFPASPIPPLIQHLKDYATYYTKEQFDIVLIKVYDSSDRLKNKAGYLPSLAMHRDVDGSPMKVACLTFATDPTQLCELQFTKYDGQMKWKNNELQPQYSYNKQLQSIVPQICSMWYMSGNTNSEYSHIVRPKQIDTQDGIRLSVTFRQSKTLQTK